MLILIHKKAHVVYWIAMLILAFYLNNIIMFNQTAIIIKSILNVLILAGGFYINLFILIKKYLDNKKISHYFFLLIGLLIIVCLLRYVFDYYWYFNYLKPTQSGFRNAYWASLSLSSLALVTSANGFYFTDKTFQTRENELLLRNEKLTAEMNFLKAQVNPHFLFNALNNIYSLAYNNSERTPEYILQLSSLMQYMIYEGAEDKVLLAQEVNYIKNYLELQKLKSEEELSLKIDIDSETQHLHIPPLIFIPFIENAFIYSNVFNGGEISIRIQKEKKHIRFSCINTKSNKPPLNKPNGGIGIKNVKLRLELLFPNNHTLHISENNTEFLVNLTIPVYD